MAEPYWRRGHWMLLAFYIFWIFILPKVYGGWRVGYLKYFNIIYAQSIGIIMVNVLMYFLFTLLIKHFENPIFLIVMTILQILMVITWGIICTKIYLYIYPPRKVLLVYSERPALGLMKKINTRSDRFIVGEMIHISEGFEIIKEKVKNYQGMVICDIPSSERNRLLKYCCGMQIRTYTTPKISDVLIRSAESQHMFDAPLLLFRNTGLTIEQRFIKRMLDIILSSLALIPALPIMGVISLFIKFEDGGSVIYKQNRLTFGEREFYVYKFRSMKENAEEDGVARLAGENDFRITKTGKIIRAIRFDELPQLFNILKGDMSLVGPRPERPEIAHKYEAEIPEFSYRLQIKAGLTGYAQVYGKYNTTAYDKLKLDLMYIQNYSLKLDLEIMLKTILILFMRDSTEGMEEGQLTAMPRDIIQEKMADEKI